MLAQRYDSKQSDGEVSVMLEIWGMQNTPSLPLLQVHSDSEWLSPDRILSMGLIEQNTILKLKWIVRNICLLMLNTGHLHQQVFVSGHPGFELAILFYKRQTTKCGLFDWQSWPFSPTTPGDLVCLSVLLHTY